jgi:hypothetical protein
LLHPLSLRILEVIAAGSVPVGCNGASLKRVSQPTDSIEPCPPSLRANARAIKSVPPRCFATSALAKLPAVIVLLARALEELVRPRTAVRPILYSLLQCTATATEVAQRGFDGARTVANVRWRLFSEGWGQSSVRRKKKTSGVSSGIDQDRPDYFFLANIS